MGDDLSQRNEPAERKRGLIAKNVRHDQPSSTIDSSTPRPHASPCHDLEIRTRHSGRPAMNDDQRGLAVRYMPLAQALARRAVRLGAPEDDELQSAAYMALVEAALTFDASRKVNFATYARHRIRGALRDYQRLVLAEGWRGDPAHRPVFETLHVDMEQLGRVLGAVADRPVGAEIESTEVVEKWLGRLPRAQAVACRLIYLHGKSQDEAAALLGCSKSYMSRLHREAISRLIRDYQAACESGGAVYSPDEA